MKRLPFGDRLFAETHAATVLVPLQTCKGSYTSAVTHSLCSTIASFRATAKSTRLLAIFPPCAVSSNPQRRKIAFRSEFPASRAIIDLGLFERSEDGVIFQCCWP